MLTESGNEKKLERDLFIFLVLPKPSQCFLFVCNLKYVSKYLSESKLKVISLEGITEEQSSPQGAFM